jgi:RNA polymerase sigma factor (sigma-70 family)
MTPSDDDLIGQYVRDGSNPAFAELVQRYLSLVYSAAYRQVRSTALAGDIAQSVFLDLSKQAAKLRRGQPLAAWLHLVTRRTAVDAIRRESRRRVREQTASEIAAMKSDSSLWKQVEPLLDAALEDLDEVDRDALLQRYFANKSLREVGEILGTSEDAAQKRISRALERLRGIFLRRGIAVTAAGLATDLSAHAIVSAPAGLGAAISSGVLPAALLAQTANTLSMTALNKTLIATAVVLIASLAYETNLLGTGRNQLLKFEQKISSQQIQARQLAAERDRAAALLAQMHKDLESDRDRLKKEAAVDSELDGWLGRVNRLKDWLGRMPEKDIPEMRFLSSSDWLAVTLNNKLQTEAKVRLALTDLRRIAKFKPEMSQNLPDALKAYSKDHDGRAATEIAQLRPYLNPPLDDVILQRYEFIPVSASFWPEMPVTNGIEQNVLHEKATVDDDYDVLVEYSAGGTNLHIVNDNLGKTVNEATVAFTKAHGGQTATTAEQVLPYSTRPVDAVKFKEFWEVHYGP